MSQDDQVYGRKKCSGVRFQSKRKVKINDSYRMGYEYTIRQSNNVSDENKQVKYLLM